MPSFQEAKLFFLIIQLFRILSKGPRAGIFTGVIKGSPNFQFKEKNKKHQNGDKWLCLDSSDSLMCISLCLYLIH